MKKYLIGFVSVVLVLASILGAPTKGAKGRRLAGSEDGPDRVLWV